MILLWATRGRHWGFRFLIAEEGVDPLPLYEETFSGVGEEPEACRRRNGRIALRFPDPEGRKDAAGRAIVHDFVLTGNSAGKISSVAEGRGLVWNRVADNYARLWDVALDP
ncbi:hypothetical protein [Corynebacterium halotolerans]|uniref:hypothetical protein n=1 Tax=Corynebacterium halotolerans TaxID=225326 RepID=UPI003CF89F3D